MIRWIAIITRVDARFFSERPFKRVARLENVLGREKNRAMTTGKPGKSRGKFAGFKGLHTYSRRSTPHEDAAIEFAKRIGYFLHKFHSLNKFDQITLVAEPRMLGRVRKELDRGVLRAAEFVKKDLGHAKVHELATMFNVKKG